MKDMENNMTNIADILKDYPKGTKLYSPICGECELDCLCYGDDVITVVYGGRENSNYSASEYEELDRNHVLCFDRYGRYETTGEVMLFPSKNFRDWNAMMVTQRFKKGSMDIAREKDFLSKMEDSNITRQKAIIKGWVAVDKDSTGRRRVRLFPTKPVRDVLAEPYYYWAATPPYCESIRLDSSLFEYIEWEDEPVEAEMTIKIIGKNPEK